MPTQQAHIWLDRRVVLERDRCPCGFTNRAFEDCCIRLAQRAVVSDGSGVGVYIRYTDLNPSERVTPEILFDALSEFEPFDLMQTLAKLNLFASQPVTLNEAIDEFALLRGFYSDADFGRLLLWKNSGRAQRVTHRYLHLTAVAQMLARGLTSGERLVHGNEYAFGRLLLLLNEFCESDYDRSLEEDAEAPEEREQIRRKVVAQLYRMGFYYHHFNFGSTVGRHWALMTKAADAVRAKFPREAIDLEGWLQGYYGYSPQEMAAYGLAVLSCYFQPARVFAHDPGKFLIGYESFRALSEEHTPDRVRRFLDGIAYPWPEYADMVRGAVGESPSNWGAFLFMHRWPMVRAEAGGMFPLDIQFLLDRLTEGTYWNLVLRLGEDRRAPDIKALNRMVGRMFEWYVADIARTTFERGRRSDLWLEWDGQIEADEGFPLPDLIVREGSTLFVIEVTAIAVSPGIATALDYDQLTERLRAIWFGDSPRSRGKCGQLSGAVQAIRAGAVRPRGLRLDRIGSFVPVLVTLRDLPQWGPLSQHYYRMLEDGGVPSELRNAWQFWNIEELEDMLRLRERGRRWQDVLRSKATSNMRWRSLKQHLVSQGMDRSRLRAVEAHMRDAMTATRRVLNVAPRDGSDTARGRT